MRKGVLHVPQSQDHPELGVGTWDPDTGSSAEETSEAPSVTLPWDLGLTVMEGGGFADGEGRAGSEAPEIERGAGMGQVPRESPPGLLGPGPGVGLRG